jgi:hypothetical protein
MLELRVLLDPLVYQDEMEHLVHQVRRVFQDCPVIVDYQVRMVL